MLPEASNVEYFSTHSRPSQARVSDKVSQQESLTVKVLESEDKVLLPLCIED